MRSPLISVVMATYQGDDISYLMQAVDSILNQTYKSIEFIIVVDGPIDNKRSVYFANLNQWHEVIVVTNKINRGPSFSRNLGISKSRGEYIAIMDADDISSLDRFSHQLEYLINNKLELISSYLDIINEEGALIGFRKVPIHQQQLRRLAPFRCPLHNPSAFGVASIFKRLQYDTRLRVSEDYDLWVRALLDNVKLGNTPYSCVKYRQSSDSISKRIGIGYAFADFSVKWRAAKLLPIYLRPLALCVALLASIVRLMPLSVFKVVYKYRADKMI